MILRRNPSNPLIEPEAVTPSCPDFEILGTFNAGATLFDGEPLLLVRVAERPTPRAGQVSTAVWNAETASVERLRISRDDPALGQSDPRIFEYRGTKYLTSLSHLRVARPDGGPGRYRVAAEPALFPASPCEAFGIEDARITRLGEDYLVTYSAVSPRGVVTALAVTRDFKRFERRGILFGPENKDVAIFPEKISGRYVALHRPGAGAIGTLSIWLASSENLRDWGGHAWVAGPRPGSWDCERIGGGAPPLKTRAGWLIFYHGANDQTRYCAGAMVLDLAQPWKVIARSERPVLEPRMPYETTGFMPGVVFHNGLVETEPGRLTLFYGAADDTVCSATVELEEILHGVLGV